MFFLMPQTHWKDQKVTQVFLFVYPQPGLSDSSVPIELKFCPKTHKYVMVSAMAVGCFPSSLCFLFPLPLSVSLSVSACVFVSPAPNYFLRPAVLKPWSSHHSSPDRNVTKCDIYALAIWSFLLNVLILLVFWLFPEPWFISEGTAWYFVRYHYAFFAFSHHFMPNHFCTNP